MHPMNPKAKSLRLHLLFKLIVVMSGGNLFISEFALDFVEFINIGDQHFNYMKHVR